jgi:hypothetical protein
VSQYMDEYRRSMGLSPRRQPFYMTPEEEESLAAQLARQGMSSVQYIGESIDKPMAAIRGALAGRPEELLNAIPFSDALGLTSSEGMFFDQIGLTDDENTVYGRDLLETYGVLGKNKEGFGGSGDSWDLADAAGDIAGFGIDLIGLPVGTGAKALSKGGQALRKAGILDDVALATAKAGKAPLKPAAMGTVSDALAMSSDPLESLAQLSRTAKQSGDDLSKLYNQRVGYTAALRAPLGIGRGVQSIEGVVDPLLAAAGRIPGVAQAGQVASATGRALGGALSGRNQNMFSELGQQNVAPVLTAQREALERNARDVVSGVADTFNRNQEAFTKLGGGDATTGYYKLYEGQLGPTQDMASVLQNSGRQAYDELAASQGRVRQALDTIPAVQQQLGVGSNMLEDEFVNYMTRSVLGKPRASLGGGRTMAGVDGAGTLQRSDYLKNIPGGTATLREIAKRAKGMNKAEDIANLARTMGVPEDQLGDLAKFFLELDPKVLEAGVYTDPINALSNRLMSAAKGQANAATAADVLGNEQLIARSLAQGGETSTIGQVANQLGLQRDTFLTETARRAGIDVDTGNLASAAGLEALDPQAVLAHSLSGGPAPVPRTLRDAAMSAKNPLAKEARLRKLAAERNLNLDDLLDNTIGQTTSQFADTNIGMDLAKDIANINPNVAGPSPVKPLMDAYDSITSLFKGSVTSPFPAFNARNRVSGAVREALAGANNLGSLAGLRGRGMNRADNIAAKISRGMPLAPDEAAAVTKIPGIAGYMQEGSSVEDALRRLLYRDMPGQGQGYALDTARDAVRQSAAQTPDEITNIGMAGGVGGTQGFSFREALDKLKPWGPDWKQRVNPMNQRGVLQGEGALGTAGLKGVPRAETKFAPAASGQYVGEHVENLNRIGPYLQRIFAGADPTRAAKDVLETQIDYSSKGLSKFENDVLTRLIPFYKFSRGNLPYVAKQLATDPGGRTAALIKAPNATHRVRGTENQILPDYVAESLAIPLGTNADGSEQFLRGLGLMEEDIFGVINPQDPIKGGLAELAGRLNPLIKAPIELASNQSFFQQGRPLDQMDPTIGRLISNVQSLATGEEQKLPAWRAGILDHLLANAPSARATTTLRQLTDRRKLPEILGGLEGNTGAGLLANLMTGLNVSDVSEGAMDKQLRDLVGDSYSSIGGRSFETIYLPEEVKANLTPEQLAEVERLKALKRLLSQRRKQRALAVR